MNAIEGFRVAIESILTNPLRSILTLLGIVMGVSAIIAVIAIINGLNLYVEEKIIRLGPSSFEINRFGIITNRKDFLRAIVRNPELRVADGLALRERCSMIEMLGMKTYGETEARFGNRLVRSVQLKGITPEIMQVEPYELGAGRILTDEDASRSAAVAFLGYDVAAEAFGTTDPVGKQVKLGGRSFEVIGTGAQRGSVFGRSRDNYVLMPISTFQKIFGSRESVAFVARARHVADVEQAMDEARIVLRARHHLRYSDEDDFGIVSPEAMSSLWKNMSRTIFQVALFVVGISLVVGGIVIMNIMLVSVLERTREVGLRKAVGARQRDIRRQFLIESVVLSSTGGVLGVSLAYAVTVAIRVFSPFPAAFPWWAPLLAISISSAVGMFFGIYPAAKAARLHPIEALRKD